MKKIIEHIKNEWYKYAIEIIVLVIGIYGAFALDNWNEQRKAKKQQRIYLEHILSNLQDDQQQLDSLLIFATDLVDGTNVLIESFKKQKLDEYFATSMAGVIAVEKNFNGYRSGMDALLNSGQLELLPANLSLSLQQYYENSEDIVKRETMSNGYINDFYQPYVFERFAETFVQMDVFSISEMYKDDTRPAALVESNTYLADRQLEIHIIIRNIQSKIEAELYQSLLRQNIELQEMIQSLLQKE